MEECIPDGFEWKDPSKIQRDEIYRLLDHWRARQASGLEPLIWVPTCPLFKGSENTTKRVRAIQQARALQPPDSDEEVFILPDSDEIDLEEESDQNDNDHSEQSSQLHDSSGDGQDMSAESPEDLDVHMDHSDESIYGESHIMCFAPYTHSIIRWYRQPILYAMQQSKYFQIGWVNHFYIIISLISPSYSLEDAGPSMPAPDHPKARAPIKQPYSGKGTWYIEIPERKPGI
jgi:hypothetical protein